MLALLAGSLFPYGPPPGPVEPSPTGSKVPWHVSIPIQQGDQARTFDLPQGILVTAGDAVLLDPTTGRVRWRAPLRGGIARSANANRGILLDLWDGGQTRLDPATGRTLGGGEPSPGRPAYRNPYVAPAMRAFRWHGGWALAYGEGGSSVDDEDGVVGVALARKDGDDDWHGAFMGNVVRVPMGTTIGDLNGHGDDGPERRIYPRAICADEGGVWLLRRGFGAVADLIYVDPLGFVRQGPKVESTDGLPAWTRRGIVYARSGMLFLFDGRRSRRIMTIPKGGGGEPWTARLTRWGLLRTENRRKGAVASTIVCLTPLSNGP